MRAVRCVAQLDDVDGASALQRAKGSFRDGRVRRFKGRSEGSEQGVRQAVYDKNVWSKTVEGGLVHVREDPGRDAGGEDSRGKGAAAGGIENSEVAT